MRILWSAKLERVNEVLLDIENIFDVGVVMEVFARVGGFVIGTYSGKGKGALPDLEMSMAVYCRPIDG
jgi:hypothetical protein